MIEQHHRRLMPFLACVLVGFATTVCCASEGSLPKVAANSNRAPAGRIESGVLTVHLELRKGVWHPEAPDGRAIEVYSFAEEGHELQVPGPLIRVPEGAEIHASVHNLLPDTVFVHGLHQHPGKRDDYLQLAPGETKQANFSPGDAGSYFYWASTSKEPTRDLVLQESVMSGAFIVDAPGASTDDRIFVIQVWAQHLYEPTFDGVLTINGKSWPRTERLHAQLGQSEHWRIVNASPLEHPMHLHGFYFYVDAESDGEAAHRLAGDQRPMVVTQVVEPRHTFDMTWTPERTGNWLFHCHILDHMMGDYKAPWLYGPAGPPPSAKHEHGNDDAARMGMGDLVLGITVTGDNPRIIPAKATVAPPVTERHLFVRERPARAYVPSGPGFYLEGVSKEVEAAGPPLVVTRGERTAIVVHNELNEPTVIHWHGLEIESYYDGVPGWDGTPQHTTPYINPGESFVAYMTPPRAGTFIYHTHWHDVKQLTSGLYGALLVLEPGQNYDPATDKVFLLGRGGLNEMHDPLVLNGSPQPGLMVLTTGHSYRFRFVNITPNDARMMASLNTSGHPAKWRALAKDGADLPAQRATLQDAVQTISVGETYDFEFTPSAADDYELRISSPLGNVVTQTIAVVPPADPFSVFADKR